MHPNPRAPGYGPFAPLRSFDGLRMSGGFRVTPELTNSLLSFTVAEY